MSWVREFRPLLADNDADPTLQTRIGNYREQAMAGAGDGGGLGPRVAKLEAHVEHIQRDIGELRQDSRELKADMRDMRERMAKLEERVSHLPGKGFIVSVVMLALAVITGLIVFQSRIEAFVENRPAASVAATPGN